MLENQVLPRLGQRLGWDPLLVRRVSNNLAWREIGCSLLKDNARTESGFGCDTRLIRWTASRMSTKWQTMKALGSDRNGKNGNGVEGWDPSFEIEVPAEQRPANELAALKEGALYSWAQLSPTDFAVRLGGLWLLFFVFLGGPIASASFEPTRELSIRRLHLWRRDHFSSSKGLSVGVLKLSNHNPHRGQEPLKFALAGGAGALFAVAVIVLRLYLGWSYVGNRLLSAVVPYEETGWYDGQLWVKPPEVLARDRLLGAYQVKPVMNRLKQTLLGAAALLATATISLFLLVPSQDNKTAVVFTPQRRNSQALTAEGKVGFSRKEDLLNLPIEVMDDDELAAAAAAAARGRPVYCRDRFYRALAGGQYCRWEDLRK